MEIMSMSDYMKMHIITCLYKYYMTLATAQTLIIHLDSCSYLLPVISLPSQFSTFKTYDSIISNSIILLLKVIR